LDNKKYKVSPNINHNKLIKFLLMPYINMKSLLLEMYTVIFFNEGS